MAKDKGRPPRLVRIRRRRQDEPEAPPGREAERPAKAEPPPEGTDAHTRIVVPRQGRAVTPEAEQAEADVQLREVRFGATSRGPYLRIVPRQRRLKRVA